MLNHDAGVMGRMDVLILGRADFKIMVVLNFSCAAGAIFLAPNLIFDFKVWRSGKSRNHPQFHKSTRLGDLKIRALSIIGVAPKLYEKRVVIKVGE